MSLKYVQDVAKALTEDMDCYSNVILGARVDPGFEGKCRVMAIMTGVQSPNLLCSRPERRTNPTAPAIPNTKSLDKPQDREHRLCSVKQTRKLLE